MTLIIIDQDKLINSGLADQIVRDIGYVAIDDLDLPLQIRISLKRIIKERMNARSNKKK